MRQLLALLVLVFAAAFAYTIGSRLASESRALVVGVAIGVVASIPAALLSVLVTTRANVQHETMGAPDLAPRSTPAPPPVVVVNAGQGARCARYAPYIDAALDPSQPRSFTIIGDDQN